MYDAKMGKTYGTGVALTTAKKREDAKTYHGCSKSKGHTKRTVVVCI